MNDVTEFEIKKIKGEKVVKGDMISINNVCIEINETLKAYNDGEKIEFLHNTRGTVISFYIETLEHVTIFKRNDIGRTKEIKIYKNGVDNMDKKEILKDLLSIVYSAGVCSGAWDDEYGRDKPVEEFLNTMKHFAKKYDIVIPELKEFKNPKDNIDSYQVKDALASHLQYELEEKLKRELL